MDSTDRMYFHLFSNCVLVKGYCRSTICDLQKGEIHLIPNDLQETLNNCSKLTIGEIKSSLNYEDSKTLDEYLSFLIDSNLGMYIDECEMSLFPDLKLDFDSPSIIENAIIDIGVNEFNYDTFIKELNYLGCKAAQIRFFKPVYNDCIISILAQFNESRIRSIELIVSFSQSFNYDFIQSLISAFPRVTCIIIHSVPPDNNLSIENFPISVVSTTERISDESHCGYIAPSYFSVNINHFTESLVANTCLNKKISVDQYGNIKNCPAMKQSFGHISNLSLNAVITNEHFRNNALIKKDEIEVCKDCEFRHVCSDCRAHLNEPSNILSKPKNCKYDPYTSEWNA